MAEQFLRLPRVLELTGYSRASIYAKVSEGTFPRPVKLGGKATAWLSSEVVAWMHARIKESRSERDASPPVAANSAEAASLLEIA